MISYADALSAFDNALARRAEVLDALEHSSDFAGACARLRTAMRSHTLPATSGPIALQRVVRSLDDRTRRDGFHVLESWDYRAQRFAADISPVLMLDRHAGCEPRDDGGRAALSVLLAQYFLTLLGLCAVRAWDEGDANANLDAVSRLVRSVQDETTCGHRFVDDAGTLLLLAISHYHPNESAYDALLEKVWSLGESHRFSIALACAGVLGGHLRWGLRYMYHRDVGRMREDNLVDYPWLLFAASTLMHAYVDDRVSRTEASEGLMNAFTADPWAFMGNLPAGMRAYPAQHAELRQLLHDHAGRLGEDFAEHRPDPRAYSPLAFQCNFLCNAFVAMVGTALVDQAPHPSLNGLFTRRHGDGLGASCVGAYARKLMHYAGRDDDDADRAALIVYDPYEAAHSFNMGMQVLAGRR